MLTWKIVCDTIKVYNKGGEYMAIDKADWHWDDTEKLYRKTNNVEGKLTEEQQEEIWLLASNHIGLF